MSKIPQDSNDDFYKQLGKHLKKMRRYYDISEEYIGDRIGISIWVYLKLEKGVNYMDESALTELANMYSMTLDELFLCKMPHELEMEETGNIRISIPQENKEKFRETLLYIIEKVGFKENIGKTAICILLYFIDFDYYEKYEEQFIGAVYIKKSYGPIPKEFQKIIDEMIKGGEIIQEEIGFHNYKQKKYRLVKEPTFKILSTQELAHIDDILLRLSDLGAGELGDYSSMDVPWIAADDNGVIDYEAVFYRKTATSVRKYDE